MQKRVDCACVCVCRSVFVDSVGACKRTGKEVIKEEAALDERPAPEEEARQNRTRADVNRDANIS